MSDHSPIQTTGILHFTIPVRDHHTAAVWYRDLLGCEINRINRFFAFMRCGKDWFVLATMPPEHLNANPPKGTKNHHAFMVRREEFDRAMDVIKARGVEIVKYEDTGHVSFPGRHVYFHDPDGNCLEIIDLRMAGEAE